MIVLQMTQNMTSHPDTPLHTSPSHAALESLYVVMTTLPFISGRPVRWKMR